MASRAREERRALNRAADRENRKWPEHMVPFETTVAKPDGALKVWRSRHFIAMLFLDDSHWYRLSVQRVEHAAFRTDTAERSISWDELMTVKRECGFAAAWAVEVYPPDKAIVNDARMRHLFFVESTRLPFAWNVA